MACKMFRKHHGNLPVNKSSKNLVSLVEAEKKYVQSKNTVT